MNFIKDFFFQLDNALFIIINHKLTNPFFDLIFPIITDLQKTLFFKFLVFPFFILITLKLHKKIGAVFIVFFILTLALTDSIGGHIIKPYFERLRPPLSGLDVILRAPHYGGFSFISNHASNTFCAAFLLSSFYPKAKYFFYSIAILVSFSRIYVGVHYPFDVIGGALFGTLVGFLCWSMFNKFFLKKYKNLERNR